MTPTVTPRGRQFARPKARFHERCRSGDRQAHTAEARYASAKQTRPRGFRGTAASFALTTAPAGAKHGEAGRTGRGPEELAALRRSQPGRRGVHR